MDIGIVSLGLIGGSILKALSEKGHNLYAVTRNPETIKSAEKYAQNVSDDMSILRNCSMVFAASPINKTLEILDKLEDFVNEDCIVMDCASVKEFVMKKRPYKFIASHPMAGSEKTGFNASKADLFKDAVWVLCPFEDTLQSDIEKAEEIIKLTGAHTIYADAAEHDRAAALISHFPLLVSQALFYSIKDNELAKKMASSGFRDMTRLAASNLEMAADMMNYNSKNIDFAAKNCFEAVKMLKNTKDTEILSEIKNARLMMYSPEGKNILLQQS